MISEVSQFVYLEPDGHLMRGVCPFCDTLEPTFVCSDEKIIFYCFRCGEGGGVEKFLQMVWSRGLRPQKGMRNE